MQVEFVFKDGRPEPTGRIEDEMPLDGIDAIGAHDVQMDGWVRRFWIRIDAYCGDLEGVVGWADAIPVEWVDGAACIGSHIRFTTSLALDNVLRQQVERMAAIAAERVLAANDDTPVASGESVATAKEVKREIASVMRPNGKRLSDAPPKLAERSDADGVG